MIEQRNEWPKEYVPSGVVNTGASDRRHPAGRPQEPTVLDVSM